MKLINSKGESIHMTQAEINSMLIASELKSENNLDNSILEYENKKLNSDLEECMCDVIRLEDENKRLNLSINKYIKTDASSREMVISLNNEIKSLDAKILDIELSSDKKYEEKYITLIEELTHTVENLRESIKDLEYEDSQNKKILTIIRKNIKASIVRGKNVTRISNGFVNSLDNVDSLRNMLADLTVIAKNESCLPSSEIELLIKVIIPDITIAYNKLIKSVLKNFDIIPECLNKLSDIESVYLELDTLSLYLDEIDSDYIEWCNNNGLTYKMDDFSSVG